MLSNEDVRRLGRNHRKGGNMDKRRYERVKIDDCLADLSDGNGFFSGTVGDISRHGLLLEEIPKRFNIKARRLTVVFAVAGKHFKIVAAPRWVDEHVSGRTMGVEILKAPTGWAEFVMKREPKQVASDAWTGISLRN